MHLAFYTLLNAATLATMVPPGELTENHAHPYHWAQPEIHRFERQPDDDDRRLAWEAYVQELDNLWKAYRNAGSTPRAWLDYKKAVGEAKRRYVYDDIYLAPVLPVPGVSDEPRVAPPGGLFPATPAVPQPPVILSLPNYTPYVYGYGQPHVGPLPAGQ